MKKKKRKNAKVWSMKQIKRVDKGQIKLMIGALTLYQCEY